MAEARKRVLNPKTVCPPIKPYYSNAVIVSSGPLMFVAGQASLDKAGKVVGAGDLRAQAVQTLENIKAICEAAGATMADIVEVTNYVTDIRAFHDITDIRNRYFPKDGPASVICEISKLALPELMIEISAIVALPARAPARARTARAKAAARPARKKKAAKRLR
jgi:enamine deaminase RidA (YjgF/YER057c/UK114 family)